MVPGEPQQEDSQDGTKEGQKRYWFVVAYHIHHDIIPGCIVDLPRIPVSEHGVYETQLVDLVLNYATPEIRSVKAKNVVEEEEQQKRSYVPSTNALIDPYAVMIKSSHTTITCRAML